MAPQVLKCIPIPDRDAFSLFSCALLAGPVLDQELRYVLTLVLLLRHPEVQQAHPTHALVHALVEAAAASHVSEVKLAGWVENIQKHWKATNSSALSIAEV